MSEENRSEEEVWNAISAFEQILEAMPEDRVALQTLYEAYERLGDVHHALNYLIRLATVIVDERDATAASSITEKLKQLGGDDPAALQVLEDLENLALLATQDSAPASATRAPRRRNFDLSPELSLAWSLHQEGLFDEEQYAHIVQDLTESSSKTLDVPISVLHVLEDRHFPNIPKIMGHLCKTSGYPPVLVSDFDIQPDVYETLPMTFMSQRGALVFDRMGKDLLIAILNPMNEELMMDVCAAATCDCHFYLTTAEAYDLSLQKIRAELKNRGH